MNRLEQVLEGRRNRWCGAESIDVLGNRICHDNMLLHQVFIDGGTGRLEVLANGHC
jgi:hypothetical protein